MKSSLPIFENLFIGFKDYETGLKFYGIPSSLLEGHISLARLPLKFVLNSALYEVCAKVPEEELEDSLGDISRILATLDSNFERAYLDNANILPVCVYAMLAEGYGKREIRVIECYARTLNKIPYAVICLVPKPSESESDSGLPF